MKPKINAQILYMAELMLAKAKVMHHGGHYCKIGGKQFPAQHLPFARWVMFQVRNRRRAQEKLTLKSA